jgi:PAS domain S-box-containing protein
MKTALSNRKMQIAFGSAILTLLLVGALSYRSIVLSNESDRWVRHTHIVIENLKDLQNAMGVLESGARGFILTGAESYISSYTAGVQATRLSEATVRNLTADNPIQQQRLPGLERLIARKIESAETAIHMRRVNGLQATVNTLQSLQGQSVMNEFQGVIREMQDQELRLLAFRDTDSRRRALQTTTLVIIGILGGILITAAAGWSVLQDQHRREVAEATTREAAERFCDLANNISQLAWMADEQGQIFWYNQRWFDYTGTTFEEMAGWGWRKVHHPDHVQAVVDKISRCFITGEIWDDTFPLRGRDGKYRWFLSRAVPIRDARGKVVRWFGTNTDISERKESELHQEQMESRYRGLLEAAPDAMVVVNQKGEIVLLNIQAEKQFGYSRNELLGQLMTNIIPVGFAERLIADGTRSAAEALAQQIGTGIELVAKRRDGTMFPIEIMLSPLESTDGILVTAAIRDISVRKTAALHLTHMESRYRGLLEAAPDAMVVVNQKGEIVLLNVQAENWFGYNRHELVGQMVSRIIPEGFAERIVADALRTADDALSQQIGTGIEINGRRRDGSEFPIEIMLSPLASPEGVLVTAAIRDITARKKSEVDLLQKVNQLKNSNEELTQFAYVASHDLQEPLRMVASYTQLLSKRYKGKLDSDADEFIAFAVDGATRMQRLIQDLLAYSRVDSKGRNLVRTSSEDALGHALRNLRSAIEDSQATVTHDPLPVVLADEIQLIQLFQNLIGNGIKYHGARAPCVHISAAASGRKNWIFSVRDNGLGISSQYFERIFGMFQRLHKRDQFEGTGIGLAICKKIVARHGGNISVESQPGEGSTFSFGLTAVGTKA